MKSIIIGLIAIILIVVGVGYFYGNSSKHYISDDYAIEFDYPRSLSLTESGSAAAGRGRHTIVLQSSDKPENGELPPAVSINIFNKPEHPDLAEWVRSSSASNYLVSDKKLREGVVGGEGAVLYRTDGLYPAEVAVLRHADYIIMISGERLEEGDAMAKAYEEVLSSLKLD